MGLVISDLAEINAEIERKCWLYLLDYGLDIAIAEAIKKNFVRFAERSSESRSVIVLGRNRHVQNQILSWHSVFGLPGDRFLPALLVSTINPRQLMDDSDPQWFAMSGHRAVLIPLVSKDLTTEEALMTVERVLDAARDDQLDYLFDNHESQPKNVDSKPIVMIQPNISGIGIDFNEIFRRILRR